MEQELRDYGLTETEVNVFLASLKLGSSTATQISEFSKLPRSTVYDCIRSLQNKGVMNSIKIGKIMYFEAVDPKMLISKLKEKEQKIAKILPELNFIKKTIKSKPEIEVFTGKEGIKTIFEKMLEAGKTINAISSTEKLFENLEYYFPNFIRQRIKKRIKARVIGEHSRESREHSKNAEKELREFKFLPTEFSISNAFFLFGNNLAIVSFDKNNPLAILIKDSSITNDWMKIFELIWKLAKK